MRDQRGFSVLGLLVALGLTALLAAAAMRMLSTQTEVHVQQDLAMQLEQNLRVGLDRIGDTMRSAGAAVPKSNLSTWIPWVSGFTANPLVRSSPTRIDVASCTDLPVVTLSAAAAANATTLTLASDVPGKTIAQLLDTGSRRLITINDAEFAHVVGVGDGSVSIDTNPALSGQQGLSRRYPAGTTICRVDVTSFALTMNSSLGRYQLTRDLNQGAGAETLADSITAMQVTTLVAGREFVVQLTGRSERVNPMSDTSLERVLDSRIRLRNEG
jgi:type II secretory pathway pseudopilin PulG